MDGLEPPGTGQLYKGALLGQKILRRRHWLRYLLFTSLLRAINLNPGIPATPEMHEAVVSLVHQLNRTPIPLEDPPGIWIGFRDAFRRGVSHGVRYPEYRGPRRRTFFKRLHDWVLEAVSGDEGRRALNYAGFSVKGDPARVFAYRVFVETQALLLEPFHKKGPDRFRTEMMEQVFLGQTDEQRLEGVRKHRTVARALGAGVAGAALSHLGFNNEVLDSLGLGTALTVATGAVEFAVASAGLSRSKIAARKHAGYWLMNLTALLMKYVAWSGERLDSSGSTDFDMTLQVIRRLNVRSDGDIKLPPIDDLLQGLLELREMAQAVEDSELNAALINIHSALKYDLPTLGQNIGALLAVIEAIPEDELSDLFSPEESRIGRELPKGSPPQRSVRSGRLRRLGERGNSS